MTNPVIEVAQNTEKEDGATVLSTGVVAILRPVPASLLQDVVSRIKEPQVPIVYNEEKGRKEEDPNDAEYQKALTDSRRQRGTASLDAMAMFGIELVEGLPGDNTWLEKLKFFEQLGHLDFSEFDLEDEITLEFLYKRYVALGSDDIIRIGRLSGVAKEDIEESEEFFRG